MKQFPNPHIRTGGLRAAYLKCLKSRLNTAVGPDAPVRQKQLPADPRLNRPSLKRAVTKIHRHHQRKAKDEEAAREALNTASSEQGLDQLPDLTSYRQHMLSVASEELLNAIWAASVGMLPQMRTVRRLAGWLDDRAYLTTHLGGAWWVLTHDPNFTEPLEHLRAAEAKARRMGVIGLPRSLRDDVADADGRVGQATAGRYYSALANAAGVTLTLWAIDRTFPGRFRPSGRLGVTADPPMPPESAALKVGDPTSELAALKWLAAWSAWWLAAVEVFRRRWPDSSKYGGDTPRQPYVWHLAWLIYWQAEASEALAFCEALARRFGIQVEPAASLRLLAHPTDAPCVEPTPPAWIPQALALARHTADARSAADAAAAVAAQRAGTSGTRAGVSRSTAAPSSGGATAKVGAPGKRRQKLDQAKLNKQATLLLTGNLFMTRDEVARQLGIATGSVSKLPVWKAAAKVRQGEKQPRRVGGGGSGSTELERLIADHAVDKRAGHRQHTRV